MDTRERHEADVERLTRALGEDAARVRSWCRAAASRRRIDAARARAGARWAAAARERTFWQEAREQAEIDREARSSARRMADAPALIAAARVRARRLP